MRVSSFRSVTVVLFQVALFLLLANPGVSAAEDSAAARVDSLYTALVGTMKQAKKLGVKGRYDKLAPVLGKTYDLAFMARVAVGQSWDKLSASQQEAITDAFTRMTTATYASRFDGFSGERFQVLQTADQPNGNKIVKTRIITSDGKPVQLNYLMRNTNAGWKIIDVYLNGTISELASRRAEFGSILRSGGPGALISALNRRSDKLLAGS